MKLRDAETGAPASLPTEVRAFRDDRRRMLYFGFWAEDDAVVSDFRHRDEPIYRQDVLELFLCDGTTREQYRELQVSPFNVQYDADVLWRGPGNVRIDVGWDLRGWRTETHFDLSTRLLTSVWEIPFGELRVKPTLGDSWRMNLFRCDCSVNDVALQAWIPTGAREFHIPEHFGYLDFMENGIYGCLSAPR